MSEYYKALAAKEHYGYMELPARRGEVIIKDYHSNEEFLLATNITLETLFADPTLIKYPQKIAEALSPLVFDLKKAQEEDKKRIEEQAKKIPPETTKEEIDKLLKPKTDTELAEDYKQKLIKLLSEAKRSQILLAEKLETTQIDEINAYKINGIEVIGADLYAYPPQITDVSGAAKYLAPILKTPASKLAKTLEGKNRYSIIAKKLDPEISKKIHDMINKDKEDIFAGIGLQEEYYRYYPENALAANLLGYVDSEGLGQYGIENSFNTELQGEKGIFQTQKDSIGRQVIVGDSVIEPAVDGDDVVLTIDRSIQLQVEKILEKDVAEYQADSGQIIVMDPKTGYIIALANYPSFNPNSFSDIYKKVYINLTPEEVAQLVPTKTPGLYYFYRNRDTNDFYYIFEETNKEGKTEYYRYDNFVGPEAYQNKAVSLPYEPGSTFKPVVMSIAIDDGDLKPTSTFNDDGPVPVDWNRHTQKFDYYIHNSMDNYYGPGTTMTMVLQKSLNTGMTFVAKTIGGALMYNYLMKYGFGERTDIEFPSEAAGDIAYYDLWTESELATHAFGQGLTVTLLQLANAYCALANGGVLMQPHIVKEVRHHDGTISTNDPYEIRRVISEDTASKLTSMLVSAIEVGVAQNAKLEDHYVAGKTGTAQTYKHGLVLKGVGTTIGSFCGYGPVDNPKFVVCVKFDHPRSATFGDPTAAKTSSKITRYLFDYYNLPPDKH
jgi:cell division protein FtsI/penicillin-binding protein 2